MASKKYLPKKGSHLTKKDAQCIGTRIEALTRLTGGEVTPTMIVKDARPVSSPIHKFFQWDNSKAGDLYRLQQARVLMNKIVEVVIVKKTPKEQRSFFNVTNSSGKQVYVTLNTAIKTPDYLDQLVEDAQKHIRNLLDILDMFKQHRKK